METTLFNLLDKLKKEDKNKYDSIITWDKEKIVNLLINYLNENMNCKYLYSLIEDINGNSADTIVLKDSKLFDDEIEGHDLLKYDVELLIDRRYTKNNGEIIILELNAGANEINLEYLVESIRAEYISYSRELINYLEIFVEFLINKKLSN